MAENYCGKDCTQCTFREELACPGCKDGPGRSFGGDCKQAQCCRERGHDTCETCNQKSLCGKNREANHLPEYRLEKQKRERAQREWLEKQMPLMAKCFTALFWIVIAANIPALMSNEYTTLMPVLHRTGQVLGLILSLAVVGCYFLLGKVNIRYRKVSLFMGIAVMAEFVIAVCVGNDSLTWLQLLRIPNLVLSLLGKYHLCNAHSEILIPLDYDLSEKWMRLWKWYTRIYIAMIASILLVRILPVLGLLTIGLLGIGMVVISVMELIYLYRMGARFRAYVRELKPVLPGT